jgi:ribosomal protein S18 acetylase RimI-like enzyme
MHFSQTDAEPEGAPATDVAIEFIGVDDLALIEPLWADLVEHHRSFKGFPPLREPADSWPRMVALYRELLEEPDAFLMVARRGDDVVGYAAVRTQGPEQVWKTGERLAELETLSIAEGERGSGVGTLMMDEVERECARRGIDDLFIGVEIFNQGAFRFYERLGYHHCFTWLYGKPATMLKERDPEEKAGGR